MAKSVLLVKTSSLGDVIHALPAITDLKAVHAHARLDWVVEEPLMPIARLHPGVGDIIPVSIRRWRSTWWRSTTRGEIRDCLRRMQAQTYDAVIDAQGLLKSALIALAARGIRHGLDFHSSREPLALFYERTYRISWDLHAVERNRLLLASALGYEVPQRCDYGLRAVPRKFDWLAEGAYAVFLHATSGDDKLWHESGWVELGAAANSRGIDCVLPWGNTRERDRSLRIANRLRAAVVPPPLSLDDVGGLLAGAKMVVGVDTGLTHLAAAMGVPTICIYLATDPAATGIYQCARAANVGGIGLAPSASEVLSAVEKLAP